MTVLIANDVPPAIRGHLKRWFVEPRANVFVGTLNKRTHDNVIRYLQRNAPPTFGFLSINSSPNCQGYTIERFGHHGVSGWNTVDFSGIHLIAPP